MIAVGVDVGKAFLDVADELRASGELAWVLAPSLPDQGTQVVRNRHRLERTHVGAAGVAFRHQPDRGHCRGAKHPKDLPKYFPWPPMADTPLQHEQMHSDVLVGRGLAQNVCSLEVRERQRALACQSGCAGVTQLLVDKRSDVPRKLTHVASPGPTAGREPWALVSVLHHRAAQ